MTRRLCCALLLLLTVAGVALEAQSIARRVRRPRGGAGGSAITNPTIAIGTPDSCPYNTSSLNQLFAGTAVAGTFALDHVAVECSGATTIGEVTATGTATWFRALTLNTGTTTCRAKVFDVNAPSTVKAQAECAFVVTEPDAGSPTVNGGADFSVGTPTTVVPVSCVDDVGCVSVRWSGPGGSGPCVQTSGPSAAATTGWSCTVSLVATSNRTTANALTFTGTDQFGRTGTDAVTGTRTVTLTITTASLGNAVQNIAMSARQLTETGGTGAGQSWDNNGAGTTLNDADAQCAGMTISTSGSISGTPTTLGTCSFTARLTDNGANTATKALTIEVAAALIGSHAYFQYVTALPEIWRSWSLRQQSQLDAYVQLPPSNSFTYVYPGALPADCKNGSCNDTYGTPLDGTKFYHTPRECIQTDVTRKLSTTTASTATNPAILTIAAGTTINTLEENVNYPATITSHSDAGLNGSRTVFRPAGSTTTLAVLGVTGAGTGLGGSITVIKCDCTSPDQLQCSGAEGVKINQAPDFPIEIGGSTLLPGNIVSSAVVNATTTQITMSEDFGANLATGQRVAIRGHVGSSPLIANSRGPFTATVTGARTFTIAFALTSGGTGGTVRVHSSTDTVLMTWDWWPGMEWYQYQGFTTKIFKVHTHSVENPAPFWTMFQNTVDSWQAGVLILPDLASTQNGFQGSSTGSVTSSDEYPPGNTFLSADRYQPTGLGAFPDRAPGYSWRVQEWNRIWVEIALNQPDTTFSDWKTLGTTGEGGAASALAGRWARISMWIASETQPLHRVFHQVPVLIGDDLNTIATLRFEFQTSRPPPWTTVSGANLVGYLRNLAVLKNKTITYGACTLGETPEVCSARDVTANTALFVQPVP
jgi:hypothetical protein